MKQYLSIFRIRFINSLQYRAAALAGIATQFSWGFLFLLMFRAFYRADASAFPMTFPQLASYIWLQQAFLALFEPWFLDNDIFEMITGGNIAYELSRPFDLYAMWFTKNLAGRCAKTVLRCLPILAVAFFLPEPLHMSLPHGGFSFLMFLLTGALSAFTVVSFCMLVYTATFYTMSSLGVRMIALSFTDLLTGGIVPIPFFPDPVRKIVELTPFASMQNLPLRVYSGNIEGTKLIKAVLLQIVWLITLVLLGHMWMKNALKKVVVQGG